MNMLKWLFSDIFTYNCNTSNLSNLVFKIYFRYRTAQQVQISSYNFDTQYSNIECGMSMHEKEDRWC